MRKHAFIAAAICIAVSAVTFGLIKAYPSRSQSQRPTDQHLSLREIATRGGQATLTIDPKNLHRFDTLTMLTHGSAAVVLGVVKGETSSLVPPQERMIVTDYDVIVSQSIKGNLQPNQAISVREPGGRVQLEGGKVAEATMPDYWKNPEVGKTYVLFLESRPDGHFVLTGGPQGLFEITPAGKITPKGKATDRLMQANDGKSTSAFIDEIQKAEAQPIPTDRVGPKPKAATPARPAAKQSLKSVS